MLMEYRLEFQTLELCSLRPLGETQLIWARFIRVNFGFVPVNPWGYSCDTFFWLLLLTWSPSLALNTATMSHTWTVWLSSVETKIHINLTGRTRK